MTAGGSQSKTGNLGQNTATTTAVVNGGKLIFAGKIDSFKVLQMLQVELFFVIINLAQ